VPFFNEDGLLGFVLLAAAKVPSGLTWEDRDLLKTVSSQVGGFLAQYESNQALAQARQFEAFNKLTAFLMHDLKNLVAQQSMIVQNADRHKNNPAFIDDMIMTVDNSVKRMSRLLEQLRRNHTAGDMRRVEVGRILQEVIEECRVRLPEPQFSADGNEAIAMVDPEGFSMILGHIVRNAQEATQAQGQVNVRLSSGDGKIKIEIEDDGMGMDPAFVRESLFKPFYTTKSSRGMGIGAYQARELIRGAGGDVAVRSQPGEGTVFIITLPMARSPEEALRPSEISA
jgi:putative PEP-CTERM system histidine kinase